VIGGLPPTLVCGAARGRRLKFKTLLRGEIAGANTGEPDEKNFVALLRNLVQTFGAPTSRLEIREWFGRPCLHPYLVSAVISRRDRCDSRRGDRRGS
jgi:hypothetical protein